MEREKSDGELISAYLAGDEKSFEELYFRYRKLLYGYLNNLMQGDPAGADEVFSDCWVKVIDKLPGYREEGKFSAWLFRMAKNIFIDRVRQSHPGKFIPADDENTPELMDGKMRSPDTDIGASDIGRAISDALGKLPPEQKEVFILREQELSFKEIAELQDCSLNTVLSRMRYAIKSLRIMLSEVDRGGLIK